MKAKSKVKISKGKLISRVAILLVALLMVNTGVSFIKYPEQYLSTWKCQLENDLVNGNQDAVEYYNRRYIANGKQLYGDKYIIENEYLNMATIVGYETSDDGVMLITNDGNGYFVEK